MPNDRAPTVDVLRRPQYPREFREREDAELRDAIEAVPMDCPHAGYRTVLVHLRRCGRWVGERWIQICFREDV